VRGISQRVLARDMAWTLADGDCKALTREWNAWETAYTAARTTVERAAALTEPAAVCAGCPVTFECAELAWLSGYTGIAGGQGYRNGQPDDLRQRRPMRRRRDTA